MIKNQRLMVIIVINTCMLLGCSTTWNHPTASDYDFQRDIAQCKVFASQASPTVQNQYNPYLTPIQQANQSSYQSGQNFSALIGQAGAINSCMQSKGYYK